ncbi:MAG: hypothetical protein LBR12_05835 [Opitutaceae bacterium]|jgi:hypothetical protein|nr:hypothetical protein [Opitutaceae bacterium]
MSETTQPTSTEPVSASAPSWEQKPVFQGKFFTFAAPWCAFIDSGALWRRPVRWLYIVCSALFLLFPLFVIYQIIDNGVFRHASAKEVFAVILSWIFVAAASWLAAQIFWNRKDTVLQTAPVGADFAATPVVAHFIRTFGEAYGTWFAVTGFGLSLVLTIFLGDAAGREAARMGIPLSPGVAGIFLSPVIGFLTIIGSRFLSEQVQALAAIANNTARKG